MINDKAIISRIQEEVREGILYHLDNWTIARLANSIIGPGEGHSDSYSADSVAKDREYIVDSLEEEMLNDLDWYCYLEELIYIGKLLGICY